MASSDIQPTGEQDIFAELHGEELYWRDRQQFLESRGYQLRPRYRPNWKPSWRGKPYEAVFAAEDAYALPVSGSATVHRISD